MIGIVYPARCAYGGEIFSVRKLEQLEFAGRLPATELDGTEFEDAHAFANAGKAAFTCDCGFQQELRLEPEYRFLVSR